MYLCTVVYQTDNTYGGFNSLYKFLHSLGSGHKQNQVEAQHFLKHQ
jgi:hypothetical protein